MSVVGLTLRAGGIAGGDTQRIALAFERLGTDFTRFGTFLFPRLAEKLEEIEARQFGSQGAAGSSGAWAELSAAYADWKEEHYPGKPILEATGALVEGMTSSRSPYAKRVWDNASFLFGTSGVPYASFHQTGTSKMPARAPIDISGPEVERELVKVAADVVREMVKAQRLDELEAA